MQNVTHLKFGFWREEGMDVIRHHTPGMQDIPLTVEMKQCVLYGPGQSVIAKKTAAVTAIEKILDPPAPFEVGFLWRPCLELIAPTCEHGLWQ